MRYDVNILLEKLGKSQFRYQEFADRFSDLDTWPVFEAVIRDPRIFNTESGDGQLSRQPLVADVPSIASAFSQKYGADEGLHVEASPERPSTDVRTLLTRISSAAGKGTT